MKAKKHIQSSKTVLLPPTPYEILMKVFTVRLTSKRELLHSKGFQPKTSAPQICPALAQPPSPGLRHGCLGKGVTDWKTSLRRSAENYLFNKTSKSQHLLSPYSVKDTILRYKQLRQVHKNTQVLPVRDRIQTQKTQIQKHVPGIELDSWEWNDGQMDTKESQDEEGLSLRPERQWERLGAVDLSLIHFCAWKKSLPLSSLSLSIKWEDGLKIFPGQKRWKT